jgi:hypothetical protein
VDVWEHALAIADRLSSGVLKIDSNDLTNASGAEAAIRSSWIGVIKDAKAGLVSLEVAYLSNLHRRIAQSVGAESPGLFSDGISPQDWTTFKREVVTGSDDGIAGNEHFIVSQIYSGAHVRSMRLTLGWFCMNGLRLQKGHYALYPPPENHHELAKALASSGPDADWDPGSISALFHRYLSEQLPPEGK